MFRSALVIFILCIFPLYSDKVFDIIGLRDELRKVKQNLTKTEICQLVCVGTRRGYLHTNRNVSHYYGIFGIGDKFWCGIDKPGKNCDIKCSDLLADDITESVKCAKLILKADGFDSSWLLKPKDCSNIYKELGDDCKNLIHEGKPNADNFPVNYFYGSLQISQIFISSSE